MLLPLPAAGLGQRLQELGKQSCGLTIQLASPVQLVLAGPAGA